MYRGYEPWFDASADYNTNAPSYYDDLARKNKLIKMLAKKIWEYDEELAKRFAQWDKNIKDFPDDVINLLNKWLADGVLDEVINQDILNKKANKVDVCKEFKQRSTNIQWLGAIGDGETDSSSYVQQTIGTAKEIYVPAGTYVIKNIQLTNDVHFIGYGDGDVIFLNKSNLPTFIADKPVNVLFKNITVESLNDVQNLKQNGGKLTLIHSVFKNPYGVTNANVEVNNADCVIVKDESFLTGGSTVLLAQHVKKLRLLDSVYSKSTKWDNILFTHCNDFIVSGNEVFDSYRSGIVSTFCKYGSIHNNITYGNKISPSNQGGWGIALSEDSHKIKVYANTARNNARGGITIDVYLESGSQPLVSECMIYGNDIDNDALIGNSIGINNNGSKGNDVFDNTINNCHFPIMGENTAHNKIHDNTVKNAYGYFLQLINDESSSIYSNHFIGFNRVVSSNGVALINLLNTSKNSIYNNDISEFISPNSIFRINDSHNIQIYNNTINSLTHGFSPVLIINSSDTIFVYKNTFYDYDGGSTGFSFQRPALINGATATARIIRFFDNLIAPKTFEHETMTNSSGVAIGESVDNVIYGAV